MKTLLYIILFGFLSVIPSNNYLVAQPICGFDTLHRDRLKSDPSYLAEISKNDSLIQVYIIKNSKYLTHNRTETLFTIPIIIHVMHTGGAIGSIYNPSDEQLNSAVEYLNHVYKGTYPGTVGAGNLQIQFELAKRTPDDLCTDGIIRIDASSLPNYALYGVNAETNNGCPELTLKDLSRWDPSHYYNVWIVNKIDNKDGITGNGPFIAGFAYLPGISPPLDGIVVLASQFETGEKTLPHEIGHSLDLYHTFECDLCFGNCPLNILCNLTGDLVCDTDPVTESFTCRNGFNLCALADYNDNTESNYMSYTNCYNLFTSGQKDRMLASMNLPSRSSLVDPGNLALIAPSADMKIINQQVSSNYFFSGNNITLNFAEENNGSISAPPNYISFHLSPNNILTPGQNGDTYLDEYFVNQTILSQSQTTQLNKQITIPSNTIPGSYYLFFSADGAEDIDECNELNNFATVIITVSDSLSSSQSAYRYWFNNQFSQAISVNHSLGNLFVLQDSISTASLSTGLNTFNIAFKDDNDLWSSTISSMFFRLNSSYPAGSARYDYWFDNNFNTRIVKTISSSVNLFLIRNLNMGSLNPGLHSFSIRLKPDGRNWSSTISSLFYKVESPFPAGPSQYEYWFDNSYSSRVIDSIASTNNLIILDSLATTGLSMGLHTFHVRSKPNGTHWSSTTSDLFYKVNNTTGNIIRYQYWFDTNFQDTVTVNVPPTNNLQMIAQIESMGVPNGLHSFHIRHKQSNGKWSSVTSDLFYKNDPGVINNQIVRFVYWYDNNWQNSQTIFLPGLTNDSLTVFINAEDLSLGEHTVSMYFRDEGSKWSSIIGDTFSKVALNTICPFNDKLFTSGVGVNGSVTYQWQVDTGSGFIDILNSAIYSGATTDTLHLTNAPTNWYGNKYRCHITDVNGITTSEIFTLKFSLTWNGSVDNTWENPLNWNCSTIPDAYTDVYINSSLPRYPEVNSNTSCRYMKLQPGAIVVVKTGYLLNVTGH